MEASGSHQEPESLLVKRAQRGELCAFEALYRQNVGRVFALCRRMCGNSSLAEELTQEAFVRAWQKLDSFRAEARFSTWLHRLTVNVVLSYHRSPIARDGELPHSEDISTPHTEVCSSQALAVDLERAIATLPDRARTVFVLHDVEGYRHHEIAELAGMAVGTSKAQLHRARKLLREVLS